MDVEPFRGELPAYCYRMLGSYHEAEDLVQETLLRAWKARGRYDPARASVRTWLYRIATNACLTALEGRGRRPLPLGTTVAAVNSALQRARAALASVRDAGAVAEPDDPRVRAVVQRYMRAFEAADVPALVRLPADDAVLEMPPVPLWYRGSEDYGRFLERVFAMRGTGWAVREHTANGQPALAAYAPERRGGHSLQVLTVIDGRIAHNVVFADPRVFDAFGLPREIPRKKRRLFPADGPHADLECLACDRAGAAVLTRYRGVGR